jgi:hypothetical protein
VRHVRLLADFKVVYLHHVKFPATKRLHIDIDPSSKSLASVLIFHHWITTCQLTVHLQALESYRGGSLIVECMIIDCFSCPLFYLLR